MEISEEKKLGVNGFGRIGKLTVWHHIGRKYFDEIVVNLGRDVGQSLADIAHYLERDSTYGLLQNYLHGYSAGPVIREINEADGVIVADGIRIRFLRSDRNPSEIGWKDHNVRLVVDTTGQFRDPTLPGDHARGAVRGHLDAGAEKVIVSAPFKISDRGQPMPEDAITTVMGINDADYDPRRHRVVSNASCTTTCLGHMMKPLLDMFGPRKILSASMSTIHAATGSQQVLDRLPKKGATDLRKSRSVINNIILTTTGAADALRLVIPEMEEIGFIAESVRVPIATGSLVILVINFQEEPGGEPIRRETINDVYRQAASIDPKQYLHYTEKQNVSGDITGAPRAAAVIEGHETHTRTAEVTMDLETLPGLSKEILASLRETVVRVPITQAVIYGWYDNEMASYVNMLGDRTVTIAESM
ncbi:glyceraldehyde-3-phosphate dehydrogenase [Desulfonema ishimotonii]|uniref:Glyceraldehyde-3-phosphate dehydrogenase n=1 Tax=Desulfonema ishimotonii TaxID=45657 RepID=A0A401G2Y4_9BACT|nr:glyceraldehyde 3-phosphate dehydrogenase NAD-binding domain-containing protein [Desulfonema ishimotonii]GBC63587.1 glyceraldehyde-3-phosphate dehydrogenase [Desulfonema ishimotonii]